MVVRQGLVQRVIGLAIDTVIAPLLARLLTILPFGVEPWDVEPMAALRYE